VSDMQTTGTVTHMAYCSDAQSGLLKDDVWRKPCF
jgi:hypothetical protein